jgi:hypothetical protein
MNDLAVLSGLALTLVAIAALWLLVRLLARHVNWRATAARVFQRRALKAR